MAKVLCLTVSEYYLIYLHYNANSKGSHVVSTLPDLRNSGQAFMFGLRLCVTSQYAGKIQPLLLVPGLRRGYSHFLQCPCRYQKHAVIQLIMST
jgi:hypothetical protein